MPAPRRNRVTPTGEIVAIPLRGAWTGNRGNLHRGTEIVRPWASPHWLICRLEWKGVRREQWAPRRLTWLFFHDEAVALAAGHRPCASCRHGAYAAFRAAWADAGPAPLHDEIDRTLHGERLVAGTRRRRTHPARWDALPDGAFVLVDGAPALVVGREVAAWSVDGYGERRRRPRRGAAELLTPPSTVAVLRAGYPVQIDSGATGGRPSRVAFAGGMPAAAGVSR
ncbi:MAG TPA: hypothetical protein VKV21_17805 [Solirubrobacteraceae bacterium]|nr:hypothetical protein [Solirubrobacteraceae bacterium]